MKIGVQLPEIEYEPTWPQIAEMARVAEETGLDSIWVGDHLLYDLAEGRKGPWEAWSLLAALAAVTDRVELGPLVAALPFHNPAVLAKKAATVDEISGGRLVLGVGAGWNRVEFAAFGLPFERRVARFAEAFTIVRRLLAEGRIDFAGEFYTLRDCELLPRPTRPGGPPLMVGSSGPRMLALTLPFVAAWNSWYDDFDNDPDQVPALLASIDEACRHAGRPPGEVEKTVAIYLSFSGRADRRTDRRTGGNPWHGSTTAMVERFGALAAAGVGHVQAVLDPITADSIAQLGEVAARFRSAG
ncbi:MAG TPA: LLM class flavin-dependent oxidoreductase [Acidimicrobiia bacterium]|nr:LLM class flavin-dependent oxidoreductase [Acidimicrobiia bacterium]